MDTRGRRFAPLRPRDWFEHGTLACHEWWSAFGNVCWVDYETGAWEQPPVADAQAAHVWGPRPLCHAHCDRTGRWWCADESPYKWHKQPCEVLFYDRTTRRETRIVSAMAKPPMPRQPYHLDPHPQFTPDGNYIAYTTFDRGAVDVALAPTAPLKATVA